MVQIFSFLVGMKVLIYLCSKYTNRQTKNYQTIFSLFLTQVGAEDINPYTEITKFPVILANNRPQMNQKQNQNTGLIGGSIKMRKTESTKFCFHFEFTCGSQEKCVPGLHSVWATSFLAISGESFACLNGVSNIAKEYFICIFVSKILTHTNR